MEEMEVARRRLFPASNCTGFDSAAYRSWPVASLSLFIPCIGDDCDATGPAMIKHRLRPWTTGIKNDEQRWNSCRNLSCVYREWPIRPDAWALMPGDRRWNRVS